MSVTQPGMMLERLWNVLGVYTTRAVPLAASSYFQWPGLYSRALFAHQWWQSWKNSVHPRGIRPRMCLAGLISVPQMAPLH